MIIYYIYAAILSVYEIKSAIERYNVAILLPVSCRILLIMMINKFEFVSYIRFSNICSVWKALKEWIYNDCIPLHNHFLFLIKIFFAWIYLFRKLACGKSFFSQKMLWPELSTYCSRTNLISTKNENWH